MPIQTPRDLFLFELGKVYHSEQSTLQGMHQLVQQAQNPQHKSLLQQHITETQQQIRNIEQCFARLGQPATPVPSQFGDYMRDLQALQQQNPPPELHQLATMGVGIWYNHFEVGCYRELITLAQTLGDQECVTLFEQSLRQEQTMAQKYDEILRQAGQQVVQRFPRAA
ncbi:MAG: ferritin-like domain-containing protein [Chloroflexi bacterium]|nr:ferritin-like domain-containing protein [Chloroflexota bacterium]